MRGYSRRSINLAGYTTRRPACGGAKKASAVVLTKRRTYFARRCFAQRRFCAAAIFARASGLIVRFFFPRAGCAVPFWRALAQRARCADAILARAAADIVRFFGAAEADCPSAVRPLSVPPAPPAKMA